MAQTIRPGIELDGSTLIIYGRPLINFSIRNEVGRGANGIVFDAHNLLLDRREALKVWLTLRLRDTRNKVEQGMSEARKAAVASPAYCAAVYHADIVEDIFYTTFEFIDGPTMKSFLLGQPEDTLYHEGIRRFTVASAYLEAVRETSKHGHLHGDPHWSNVILTKRAEHLPIRAAAVAKFVDFGTSIFFGKSNAAERHWRVVENEIDRLFSIFPSYKKTKSIISRMFSEKICHPYKRDFYYEIILYMSDEVNKLPDTVLKARSIPD